MEYTIDFSSRELEVVLMCIEAIPFEPGTEASELYKKLYNIYLNRR